jgi:hypothetical protein
MGLGSIKCGSLDVSDPTIGQGLLQGVFIIQQFSPLHIVQSGAGVHPPS